MTRPVRQCLQIWIQIQINTNMYWTDLRIVRIRHHSPLHVELYGIRDHGGNLGVTWFYLGPHLMLERPWNCFLRACLSVHSESMWLSSSPSSSFWKDYKRKVGKAHYVQTGTWFCMRAYLEVQECFVSLAFPHLELLLPPVLTHHHLFLLLLSDHRLSPWGPLPFLKGKAKWIAVILKTDKYTVCNIP